MSICNSIGLQFRLTEYYLAFVCYLHHQFFNQQRFRADGILFPNLHKALFVVRYFIEPTANTNMVKEQGKEIIEIKTQIARQFTKPDGVIDTAFVDGQSQRTLEIAKTGKSMGLSTDDLIKLTGLTKDEIDNL